MIRSIAMRLIPNIPVILSAVMFALEREHEEIETSYGCLSGS